MSVVDEIYGSDNWLRAPDLQGHEWKLRIESQSVVEFKNRDGTKKKQVALKFFGAQKLFGVNKTNAKRMEKMFGGNPAMWIGEEITLYVAEVQDSNGNPVDGIRIREMAQPALPQQAMQPPPAQQQQPQPRLLKEFNEGQQYNERNPPPPTRAPDDMNDKVPF